MSPALRWTLTAIDGAMLLYCALTGCAGLMAVSFRALTGDFDLSWWGAKFVLLGIAAVALPGLISGDKPL